jgi:hypothetical protein
MLAAGSSLRLQTNRGILTLHDVAMPSARSSVSVPDGTVLGAAAVAQVSGLYLFRAWQNCGSISLFEEGSLAWEFRPSPS